MKIEIPTTPTVRIYGVSSMVVWTATFWSYAVNHSLLWAAFHGLVAPAYIAYRLVFHTGLLPR
jgi:hypothetical protein